jgi:nitrite reductase/ring-hydroxylating ferredoxin subunit
MSQTERIHVGPADELDPGERTFVEADGRTIGVLNIEGEFYAASNQCPHRGGPVCTGSVRGKLESEWPGPGERENEYYADEPAIACPWHGWEFDLETGIHLGDSEHRIPTYDVTVEDGDLFVEL